MTVRRWKSVVAGLGLIATMGVASGCAASGSATGESAPTSTSFYSPLNDYLTPPENGAMPTTDEEWQAKEREVQALIVTCMTEQGFEYIPFVYPNSGPGMGVGMDEDLGQRAWAEKYGYGMSTFNDQSAAQPAEVEDPNNALVEGMSEGEREAYFKALHGGQFSSDLAAESSAAAEPSAATEPSPAADPSAADTAAAIPEPDMGCWGDAQAEVYGQGYLGSGDEFQDMWDSMSQLWESTPKDERLIQVSAEWANCMGDAGHPGFTVPQDAMTDVSTRWSELNGWPAPGEEMTAAPETMTAEPTPPPADVVSRFQTDEIALAVADYDCQEKVGYQKVFEAVRIEAETQFVEEHRAELERYRDSLNGGG